jgi:hypothetical protein
LGYIGILTKTTVKIAPGRGNGIRERAGFKMKKRFFLNGVHIGRHHPVVHQGKKLTVPVLPDAANTGFSRRNLTVMVAGQAFDLTIGQGFIKTGTYH